MRWARSEKNLSMHVVLPQVEENRIYCHMVLLCYHLVRDSCLSDLEVNHLSFGAPHSVSGGIFIPFIR